MAYTAKVRSLMVRPLASSDLSFNMPGIVGERFMNQSTLGTELKAFDDKAFYSKLGIANSTGSYDYNSTKIDDELSKVALYKLRNEGLAVQLDQLISRRHNLFLKRYKHVTEIVTAWQNVYPEKINRLENLRTVYEDLFNDVKNAYISTHNENVTIPVTVTQNSGNYASLAKTRPLGLRQTPQKVTVKKKNGDTEVFHVTDGSDSVPLAFEVGVGWVEQTRSDASYDNSTSNTEYGAKPSPDDFETFRTLDDLFTQKTTFLNESFRHPSKENEIAHDRFQVNLLDEIFMHSLQSLMTADINTILKNELYDLDQEVKRLQVNFAHTYLVPKLSGRVTNIYKDAGEGIEAGEPVARIETEDEILLIGYVTCRNTIRVDQQVTVKAKALFETLKSFDLIGKVVSVRGHDSDDDVWEIILAVSNPAGDKRLPLNYHFDKHTTGLEFS